MAGFSVERYFQLSLLGLITSGYLAVAGSGFLDAATLALTALGLMWRLLLTLGLTRATISERWVTALTLGYAGFFPLDWLYVSRGFIDATIHLIFFLAVMKVITARTGRDYLYAAVIAFLELLAAALVSVNLNFFVFLVLYLAFAVAAFTSGEIRQSTLRDQRVARPGVRWFQPRLAGLAACITLGILALTAGLFFLLPRTAEAALGKLISHRYFLPGFSNQVTLGQIGELKTNSRPVMHVKVYTANAPGNLKWRGAALTRFDGKVWSSPARGARSLKVEYGQVTVAGAVQRNRAGRRIAYRVDLNAIDTDRLFFAGAPEVINIGNPRLLHGTDGGFRVESIPAETLRYEAYGNLDEAAGDIPEIGERVSLLALPAIDGRIAPLARELAGSGPTEARARRIEARLRSDYSYTLELPKNFVRDPLAYFLFERKKGHCEYFASAMTVMLRTVGIPARMVTGFQSGTFNPISELYVVRASEAHTWVEAWIEGHGWMTFDPTPPDPNPRAATLLTTLGLYLDAADSFWQQWVVAYDLTRQVSIVERLERAGSRTPTRWPEWRIRRIKEKATRWLDEFGLPALVFSAMLLLARFAGPTLWRRLRVRRSVRMLRQGQAGAPDATLLYERMLEILRGKRYEKPAWFTPGEFARSIADPELGPLVGRFTDAYHAVRFGGQGEAAEKLSSLLEELEAVR